GIVKAIPAPLGKVMHFQLEGKAQRFRAQAVIDERSRQSDISPAVRFFVFTEEPDTEQLVRVEGDPPRAAPPSDWDAPALVRYLYQHLLGRPPAPTELQLATDTLGSTKPTLEGTEDLLWALLMSPEFQYLH
ncbi:MAG: hypothetical protein KIT83_19870, partial [Bryobacterales bacterium]|nr:hypothetical protein [Bryobacterales bacterium]